MRTYAYPVTVVDGFFEDPDAVRKFALDQKYSPVGPSGFWPGQRTECLTVINPILFKEVHARIFSLFFETNKFRYFWKSSSQFQYIPKSYGAGWVHRDVDAILTAIIYLNPGPAKSNITICKPKNGLVFNPIHVDEKRKFYANPIPDKLKYDNYREEVNNLFEDSITIAAEYNRLILFEGYNFHKEGEFFGENLEDSRLTLVNFITEFNIEGTSNPRFRINNASS